jgi:hypothetical protein
MFSVQGLHSSPCFALWDKPHKSRDDYYIADMQGVKRGPLTTELAWICGKDWFLVTKARRTWSDIGIKEKS